MNVSIPPAQEHFVRAQVDAGRYRTASEVIREGLRLLVEREHLHLPDPGMHCRPRWDRRALHVHEKFVETFEVLASSPGIGTRKPECRH